MKIIHFSKTPLVAAPIRICKALSLHERVEARSVVLNPEGYGNLKFENDLVWKEDKELILSLVESADIIHLHNYVNLNSREFSPINFRELWTNGKAMVRQFHSTPHLISKMSGETLQDITECPIPKLVIAQYPERFYPDAKLVPNIVFDFERNPNLKNSDQLILSYSPSNFRASRSTRWDTKGYPETRKIINNLCNKARQQRSPLKFDLIERVPHEECLRRKLASDITIDDLVTGSYHMSTLESLIASNVVLSYMDVRVQRAIEVVSGRQDFPALNVRLEEAESLLLELIMQPDLVREIGTKSRAWMLEHWHPKHMASKFLECYDYTLENPRKAFPRRFDLGTGATRYNNIDFYDQIWRARHNYWPTEPSRLLIKSKSLAGKLLRSVGFRK